MTFFAEQTPEFGQLRERQLVVRGCSVNTSRLSYVPDYLHWLVYPSCSQDVFVILNYEHRYRRTLLKFQETLTITPAGCRATCSNFAFAGYLVQQL